ncbi:MAG: SDR family oxidoreductase [Methanothrix sp.]|jgi:UDP-glucuronate decarboxylase|nr:SDR family oxidoreductase [Methanothrix sp.]
MKWNNHSEVAEIKDDLKDASFQDQTVLVTGGAGFLGSWICDLLLAQGARVLCLDNLSSGLRSNISSHLDDDNFRFIEQDICLPLSLDRRIDLVIHMASRASPFEFEHYPLEILKANTLGLMTSLNVAKEHRSKLLYTSTSEIYGNPHVVPTPESYYGNVNPIGPRGCYDEAKRCGEAFVVAYRRQFGLDARIARIFNTYGPRIRFDGIYARALPRFIDQAMRAHPITIFGDGMQTRSFTYVADQISGLIRLAALDEARDAIVNLGSDIETTVKDMAHLVIKATGSKSEITYHPLPDDDPLRRRPDISRARELLGWRPRIGLAEGLDRTLAWYRSLKDA